MYFYIKIKSLEKGKKKKKARAQPPFPNFEGDVCINKYTCVGIYLCGYIGRYTY
jgi:hypothetical protein